MLSPLKFHWFVELDVVKFLQILAISEIICERIKFEVRSAKDKEYSGASNDDFEKRKSKEIDSRSFFFKGNCAISRELISSTNTMKLLSGKYIFVNVVAFI